MLFTKFKMAENYCDTNVFLRLILNKSKAVSGKNNSWMD